MGEAHQNLPRKEKDKNYFWRHTLVYTDKIAKVLQCIIRKKNGSYRRLTPPCLHAMGAQDMVSLRGTVFTAVPIYSYILHIQ